ncbi:MAG: hypothetical protein IJ661_04220 [Lachnospiraceae bacterium]|nr:hypothetical protein [Lachnospiraceae bacterium]
MILDCPACGAALVYDPASGKMKCESCSNLFETYELQENFLRRGERELQHQYTHSPTDNIQQFDSENSLADNTTSRKLNPYYPKYLKDFSMEYLSGFYADQYDDNMDKLKGQAILRAQNMFENAMKRSVSATGVKIIKKYPVFEITGTEYALYPAWFLTFINDGTPYTLLVNGQTEKVVGGIPYDKKKIKFYFLLLGAMLSLIAFCIVYPILFKAGEDLFNIIFLLGAIGIVSFTAGIKNFEKVKASTRLTSLSETNHYVKNRQEG